jgi:hypothetical protein
MLSLHQESNDREEVEVSLTFLGVIRKYDNVFLSRLPMIDLRSDAGPMKYQIKESSCCSRKLF